MSNLNSVFDTLRGWPEGSALEATFEPDFGVTQVEGTVVYITSRELAPARVLRIVDNSLVTAPALLAADRGKAYVVAGTGGAWSGFGVGDIVEWDGTAWNVILPAVELEPPDNTRVVVVETGAAGAFAGHENKVMQYTKKTVTLVQVAGGYVDCVPTDIGKPVVAVGSGDTGNLVSYNNTTRTWVVDPDTPSDVFAPGDNLTITGGTGAGTVDTTTPTGATWAATVPVAGNRININGTGGVYYGKYYDYTGSAWYKAARQTGAPAIAKALTSAIKAGNPKDDAWFVIQGNDQFDGRFTNKVTCVKASSGAILKLACPIADTLVPGDYVCANAGALKKLTVGVGMEWPIGQVLQSNGVAGAAGWVTIATY